MEIVRGSLDEISRPATGEHVGRRVSRSHRERVCSSAPFSLVVLSDNVADIQTENNGINSSSRESDRGENQVNATDKEKEDLKLQRAYEEMRQLDEILSEKTSKVKEIRRQRKEHLAKFYQELMQTQPEGHSEYANEALNTRLFLALEEPTGEMDGTEEDFIPVFETQAPDCEHLYSEQSEKKPDSSKESFEVGHAEAWEEQSEESHCAASKGKKKEKDFVRRNIELVRGEGGQVHLTQAEKERLAELLCEGDEDEEDSAAGANAEEDMWAVSVLTGQGYTPEPSDLEQLIDIDSKIRRLLPAKEFLTPRSSYTNLSLSQGHGSEAGWKCDGDRQPGEKVLQDIKERRGQERRLHEIQQQLEILGRGQEMTDESPGLAEEQLRGLLHDCELTESWTQDMKTNDTTNTMGPSKREEEKEGPSSFAVLP